MVYTPYFDPEACTSPSDHDSAAEILKLNVVAKRKPNVPFSLATDSDLLLSPRCAGDSAFLALVRQGHIRFPCWSDAKTVVESLIRQLKNPDTILSNWPREATTDRATRNAMIAWLRRTGPIPQNDAIAERLEHVRALSDAAESAPSAGIEPDRRPFLATRMRALKKKFLCERTYLQLETNEDWESYQIATRLPDEDQILQSRSTLYKWKESFRSTVPGQVLDVLKDVIDMHWNEVMAKLNGYDECVSIYRHARNPMVFSVHAHSRPSALEFCDSDEFHELFEEISWDDILSAMQDRDANAEIAKRYAQRIIDSKTILLARDARTAAVGLATAVVSGVGGAASEMVSGHTSSARGIILLTGAVVPVIAALVGMSNLALGAMPAKQRRLESQTKKDLDGYVFKIARP
jgi:hypothetical protein